MAALRILHLSDGRPGHYHLSEGVIAAIGRARQTDVRTLPVQRRRLVPGRVLRMALGASEISPAALLGLGYGLSREQLGEADLVVSAGGETLPANVVAARTLEAPNIFVGSLRGVDPRRFSLIVTSYERHAGLPRHLVTLKPCGIDPDALSRPVAPGGFGAGDWPRLAGLLLGGNSGLFNYAPEEWRALLNFARAVSRAWGTRWLLSTSRRTPPPVAETAFDLAKDKDVVADFIDYRLAGPGTLPKLFGRSDVVVCTEDSSTMISEAVWARLPVVGVSPAQHAFKPEEMEYRQTMLANNWCRFLPITELSVDRFAAALAEIVPLRDNPLDRLARDIQARLPEIFRHCG